jgi:hypothetical protein
VINPIPPVSFTAGDYAVAGLMVMAASVSICAAWLAWRTEGLRFKYLWVAGSFIGIGWLQAHTASDWISYGFGVNVPPFGVSSIPDLSGDLLRVSLPLVACVFLGLRALGRLPITTKQKGAGE